jgi:hypothetical protein
MKISSLCFFSFQLWQELWDETLGQQKIQGMKSNLEMSRVMSSLKYRR